MKQVKHLGLLSVLLFMSTNTFCSEDKAKEDLVTAASAAITSTTVALAWGFGPVESAAYGVGVGACTGAACKGWEEWRKYQDRKREEQVRNDRKRLAKECVKGAFKTAVTVAAGIQTVGGAVETVRKFLG